MTPELQPREEVYQATAEEARHDHLRSVPERSAPRGPTREIGPVDSAQAGRADPDAEEWDDVEELERFEFDAPAAIVRPRRRRDPNYQTLRINAPTSRIMRLQWQAARRVDPLITYTEFSTVVVQRGLQALKEDRERGE